MLLKIITQNFKLGILYGMGRFVQHPMLLMGASYMSTPWNQMSLMDVSYKYVSIRTVKLKIVPERQIKFNEQESVPWTGTWD